MDEINQVACELTQLYEQDRLNPFPYQGCRALLKGTDERMDGFIPDLALYFAEIAGYSQGAKRLNRWDEEKVANAQRMLGKSFFEKHSEYQELQARITPADTPDLYATMALYEEMRNKVLHLISLLIECHSKLPK